jgi:hypothetical protein
LPLEKFKVNLSRKSTLLLAGLGGFIVLAGLIIIVLIFSRLGNSQAPATAPVVVQPTAGPSPTATVTRGPETITITLSSPAEGLVVDLGQPVPLVISTTASSGVQMISVTSNGQGIGTFRGLMETEMEQTSEWVPAYAGTHTIVAAVSSREGGSARTEPVRIRVVDRELMSRHAPIWANVEANVTEIRGLAKLEALEPTLLSRTELRQRLADQYLYTEEDARRDTLALAAFDFVPLNFDLYSLQRRYLGESILGFYDPTTAEFVVVSNDDAIDALERWTYAHEFMHALQDQHFQLELITDSNFGLEENLAVRALAEGEADLLQSVYLEQGYLTDDDLVEIINLSSRAYTQNADYLPAVLVNRGAFPYLQGAEFADYVYQREGWAGLNRVWQNPPQSTEQIIHPDRYYAGDTPDIVTLPVLTSTIGTSWELVNEAVFGEFMLREYLALHLPEGEVERAATGWGGDRYAVFQEVESEQLLMVLRSSWDSGADRGEFIQAYATFADLAYGQQRLRQPDGGTCWQTTYVLCLYDTGIESIIVRAPDLEMAAHLAAVVRQGGP